MNCLLGKEFTCDTLPSWKKLKNSYTPQHTKNIEGYIRTISLLAFIFYSFIHFSFSPVLLSVKRFLATSEAKVLKIRYFKEDHLYFGKENQLAAIYFFTYHAYFSMHSFIFLAYQCTTIGKIVTHFSGTAKARLLNLVHKWHPPEVFVFIPPDKKLF